MQIWDWITNNQETVTIALTWLAQMVLTPLFRKIPPKNILLVLRILVGIFDKIQPSNFARHADNAKNALADADAGKPASVETIQDKGQS